MRRGNEPRFGLRRRGAGTLGAFLGLATIALVGAPAAAASMEPVVAPVEAQQLDSQSVEEYWTPERIAEAEPLDFPEEGSAEEAPSSEATTYGSVATAFKSVRVNRPSKYPNRVHGKLVGTFAGLGTYSCSATVVSSFSKSLITTAGHCVFDRGSRQFARNLAFAPGYQGSQLPYGVWPATRAITTGQWVNARRPYAYDMAMLRLGTTRRGKVEKAVGSRGIGFDQPRRQHLQAYGYPAAGNPGYNGRKLIRCDSGYTRDPNGKREGGTASLGMKCDMQGGSSGGGWVSQGSFVVSNVSHGHPTFSQRKIFGPYYGKVAKSLYKFKSRGWPSIGPITCKGRVVSIAGTARGEKIRGTNGKDVIATLGGNDRIEAKGGRDVICGGSGKDKLIGGGGKDRIEGGPGKDKCLGSSGRDKASDCERKRRM